MDLMRDPARIDRVLEKLSAYWRTRYDLRLGQIVANLTQTTQASGRADEDLGTDIFYVEDDVIEAALDKENGR